MPRISRGYAQAVSNSTFTKPRRRNMKKIAILTLALLATGVGMSLSGMVRAEDQPAAPPSQNSAPKDHDGMMMGGDMQGMMKMMGQMTKMMEKCDQMMQTKIDDQKVKPGSPKKEHRG